VDKNLDDHFPMTMTVITRLALTLCLLLSTCAFSNAQKKPDPDPLDRVLTELQAGRTEKAFAALDELIKQYPKSPDAYLLRGSLKMQTDPAQALSDFNKVIELKPDSGSAYSQRAMLRLVNNDPAGALKDLDAAIAHDFKDDSVYYLRGQLRWQAGELNGALTDLNEALKFNPNNPRLYVSRAGLLLELKEVDRALADYNYLLNWYETDPSARPIPKPSGDNAQTQSPKNDSKPFMVEMAQQTANEAPGSKEMAPIIADTYVNRGFILKDRGNHVAAFTDFDKAIRIDPTNVWAYYDRANEYEYKGDLPAALADITKALQLDPNNANLVVEHGVILLLMGKDKDAQADFDVLLKLDRALWQKRIDDRTAAVRKVLPVK
jgi:tetratricopeptide (TPR) repeat protein